VVSTVKYGAATQTTGDLFAPIAGERKMVEKLLGYGLLYCAAVYLICKFLGFNDLDDCRDPEDHGN